MPGERRYLNTTLQLTGENCLARYLIGTGGWAYFQVPGEDSLTAYSRAFNFVEVNSTFYETPTLKTVQSWRKKVPADFEFTVRCNKAVTHQYSFSPTQTVYDLFERMTQICKVLRAEILHLQTPSSFQPTKDNVQLIHNFLSSTDLQGVRLALEMRSARTPTDPKLVRMLEEHDLVHCVDLLKGEKPACKSDTLYTRLFGKGPHNVYQPTDEELRRIDEEASNGGYEKVLLTFHSQRMYKDAARLKSFRQTGGFPMVTRSTGTDSLEEILREDAAFPAGRRALIQHQGWKIIDLAKNKRTRASTLLKRLPEKTYHSVEEVVQTLRSTEPR